MIFYGNRMLAILSYYLLVNVVMYAAMYIDKKAAIKKKSRIPEKRLYLLAVVGGGIGGLFGMSIFRHKTKHIDFVIIYTISALLHMVVIYLLFAKFVFIFT
ncbi:MAG: DUF1294 domain-containing protein [Bacillota bacterium]